MRATVSPAFPAVNGLITLIGLSGHFSALAATVAIERATAAKDADNVRIDIMFCSGNPQGQGRAARQRWQGAQRVAARSVFTKIRPSGHGTWRGAVHIGSGHSQDVRFTPECALCQKRTSKL